MFLLIDNEGKLINIDDISAIEGRPGSTECAIVLRNGERISTKANLPEIVTALEKLGVLRA